MLPPLPSFSCDFQGHLNVFCSSFKKSYKKCVATLSRFQLHEHKYTKLPLISQGYEIMERLMAEMPALHLKSYWGQSLLVVTIFSSSWCQCPKHTARPGLRASSEDGCRHPAVRKASLRSGDSPSPSLRRAWQGDFLGRCPQPRLS